jgi:preprotein translocase YajC subunit
MEIALIYFAVLALAFFLLMVRPQRRRAAAHRQFVAALSVGDEVITSGGIFGTIRGLGDGVVDLEIAPGTMSASPHRDRAARRRVHRPTGWFGSKQRHRPGPGRLEARPPGSRRRTPSDDPRR